MLYGTALKSEETNFFTVFVENFNYSIKAQ